MRHEQKDRPGRTNLVKSVCAASLMAGAGWLGVATAASAQDAAAPDQPAIQAPRGVDQITVTARKREETLQTAPVSITAFDATGIESRSLESFNDLNNFAPNIELNNGRVDGGGSVAQLFIRGVGQEDYSFPNDPGVGVYLDGVYVSRSSGGDFGFMDIERIEVLRGPQGTLYGKNTIGGAINVITRKPSGENEGRVELTYGRYDRLDFSGSVDFRITDTLFAKISGMSRTRNGYGRNFLGERLRDEDKDAARIQLLYVPSSTFEVLLQADYSRQRGTGPVGALRQFWDDGGEGVVSLVNAIAAPGIAAELGLEPPFDVYGPAWINRIEETKDFTSGGTAETRDNNEIFGVSMTIDWDFDWAALKSITAYREVEIDVQRDGDHTPFDVFTVAIDERTEQLSQELQLSGTSFSDSLDWLFGLYAINEKGRNAFIAPLINGVTQEIGLDISLLTDTRIDTVSLAAFGEATYNITDRLGLTFGARLAWEEKEYTYQLDRLFTGVPVIPRITLKQDWTEFLPKGGIEFQLTDDALLYATVARGFKAGGWNPRTLTPGTEPQQFDPERITTYEIGAKTSWFDNRLTLNVAGFYSDYTNIQLIAVTEVAIDTDGDGVPDTTTVDTSINNAGAGEIYGAEIEIVARPVDPLLIQLGLGLLDTKYTDLGPGVVEAGTASLDNEFIQSPKVTFNGAIEYTIDMGNAGALVLFTDASYKSKIFRSVQNFEDLITPGYWVWNARVTYMSPNEDWELAVFVTNITNEIYLTNGVDVRGLGATEAYYSRPREWGITARARF